MKAKFVNEAIKHLSGRSEEEIFKTLPYELRLFYKEFKETYPTAIFDPDAYPVNGMGAIYVKINRKIYVVVYAAKELWPGELKNGKFTVYRRESTYYPVTHIKDFEDFEKYQKTLN